MNMARETKIIGRSGVKGQEQMIKLQKYGRYVSLVIGTPSLDVPAHAIRLNVHLVRKIRAALEQLELGEL